MPRFQEKATNSEINDAENFLLIIKSQSFQILQLEKIREHDNMKKYLSLFQVSILEWGMILSYDDIDTYCRSYTIIYSAKHGAKHNSLFKDTNLRLLL